MSDDHEVFFALAMAADHDEFHQARALRTWWPRIQSWYERLTKFESQQICACRFEKRDDPDFSGQPPKQLNECGFHSERRKAFERESAAQAERIRELEGELATAGRRDYLFQKGRYALRGTPAPEDADSIIKLLETEAQMAGNNGEPRYQAGILYAVQEMRVILQHWHHLAKRAIEAEQRLETIKALS